MKVLATNKSHEIVTTTLDRKENTARLYFLMRVILTSLLTSTYFEPIEIVKTFR